MNRPALIVIDLQNDYFRGGAFPLHNADETLSSVLSAILRARQKGIPVILVQHIADRSQGLAPFFNAGTHGVSIHADILDAARDAPVVIKHFADSFEQTTLHETLQGLRVNELLLCGMMTQNCVTHTALSRQADAYRRVAVLSDASTTVGPMLHAIALNALSTRVDIASVEQSL